MPRAAGTARWPLRSATAPGGPRGPGGPWAWPSRPTPDRPGTFSKSLTSARLLTAATATAHAHGYALTILPAARGAETLWHTLTVDGMLLLDSPTDDPVLRALRARGIPLVFDGRPVDPQPGDVWVDNDHTATTHEVLGHLTASGARRIALHAGYGDEHYTRAVTRAYEQWCDEHGRTPLLITFDPYDTPGHGFDAVFAARACDAVYTVHDRGGRHVLAAADRHGLRIPDDLLLVCASEDQAYAENDPPVSTVTLRPATIAETAVTALVSHRPTTTPRRPDGPGRPPPPPLLTPPGPAWLSSAGRSVTRPCRLSVMEGPPDVGPSPHRDQQQLPGLRPQDATPRAGGHVGPAPSRAGHQCGWVGA
ncbi:substrate-binding domain-containing protein [Streptomyces yanii]|uniref:Substrate-binding domain-containing protein n=1 Tax=Streptomyces yanii TaxID=78510 RepID=A0ABV5RIS2_9ACTN